MVKAIVGVFIKRLSHQRLFDCYAAELCCETGGLYASACAVDGAATIRQALHVEYDMVLRYRHHNS